MKKILSFAVLAAALSVTGCFHNVHDFKPSEWGNDVQVGYLVTSFNWEQFDDKDTDIDNLSLTVGGNKASLKKDFNDPTGLADELIQLPVGEYDVLVTVNMSEAEGFVMTGLPSTKATVSKLLLDDISVSLKDPASSPAQAWYGLSHITVTQETVSETEPEMQRLLSVFTVNVTDIPAGTKVTISINNIAKSVNLTALDADGRYGLPSAGSADSITLGTFTAGADGTIGVKEFTMMPTVSDRERCIITFDITTPAGINLKYRGDAPRTECGKGYTLNIDYNTLKPYMYVASSNINEWNEGWTVTGEILNPNE